jgi:hypothetical protein
LSTILLKRSMPSPAAFLPPALLLLPGDCLLLGALWLNRLGTVGLLLLGPLLLGLLGALLRWRLRGLSAPILLLVLLLWLLLWRLWLLGPLLLLPLLLLLRRLLGALLRRLLSGLSALFLRLPLLLLLLPARLLLRLRALLLCGWPAFLLLTALPGFRLAVFFLLPVLLRVCRVKDPKEEKQGSGTGCSNKLHGSYLR